MASEIRIFFHSFVSNLLNDIVITFESQYEFWNPLFMSFPKLSLVTWFDQVWAEKIKSKDRWEIWPQHILSKPKLDLEVSLSYHPIFSAHSWPNQVIKGSFGKLSYRGFQNCPWVWNLMKNSVRNLWMKELSKVSLEQPKIFSYLSLHLIFSAHSWPNQVINVSLESSQTEDFKTHLGFWFWWINH